MKRREARRSLTSGVALAEQGFSMPAEWERHRATWIAFPHHRTDFPGKLSAVPWTFAEMARVLSLGEDVHVLVRDAREKARAQAIFGRAGVDLRRVHFERADTNRSWTRDYLPIWVRRKKDGERVAVKFRFNGWARYRDHGLDERAGQWVAQERAPEAWMPRTADGELAVLEGGSIDVDGQGTLLTTTECLLGKARGRYRHLGRDACEKVLRENLGVSQIIWLPDGVAGDDTSGHVDDFARFAPKSRVLVCDEANRKDENHAPLRAAQKVLARSKDARGKALEVVRLPMPSKVTYGGMRLPASYANFLLANAGVLVPVFNDPLDREALDTIAACYPDRPVFPIYARDLVLGLGTIHCSSMQEPA